MVLVPLPQEPVRPGRLGALRAPGVVPSRSATGVQIQRLGQAMLRGGLSVFRASSELQERLDVIHVKRAQALSEGHFLEARREFRNTIGLDANERRVEIWESLQKKNQQILAGLDSPVQRDLFAQVTGRRELAEQPIWDRHEDEQVSVAEIGARAAEIAARTEEARVHAVEHAGRRQDPEPQDPVRQGGIRLPGDPEAGGPIDPMVLLKRSLRNQAIAKYGPVETAQHKAFVRAGTTDVHKGAVEDLVESGRGTDADSYLKKNKKEVESDQLNRLRHLVRNGTATEEGARLAIGIWEQLKIQFQEDVQTALPAPESLEESQARLSLTARADFLLADAAAILQEQVARTDGGITFKVRDAALAELKHLAKMQSNENALDAVQVRSEARQWLTENAPAGVDLLESRKPLLHLQAGSMGLLGELRDFAGGKDRRSDPEVWLRAELVSDQSLIDLTPAELAREFAGGLTPQHMSEVAARWRKARGAATAEDESIISKKDRITMTLVRNNNMWPARGRATPRQILDRFLIDEEIQRDVTIEKQAGRPTTGESLQKIIDNVVLDAATADGWFEKRRPVVTIPLEELPSATREIGGRDLPVIPAADRKQIEEALNQAGIPVTDDEVGRMFLLNQRRLRQGLLRNRR